MLTINEIAPSADDIRNSVYNYQSELTSKLDKLDTGFNQDIINEIVLWKVDRYAAVDNETLNLINQIKKDDTQLNPELTSAILLRLLSKEQKGFRQPMASTLLKFKNPKIYQIIDQRVFRFLYGKVLKYSKTNINEQITIYLDYLQKLKDVCTEYSIKFETADRVFYTMDKNHNPDEKLNGY